MAKLTILVVGNGGREYEYARQFANHPNTTVFVAPGNAGTSLLPHTKNVALSVTDVTGLMDFVAKNKVDAIIAGGEAPLVAGLADTAREANIPIFGLGKKAAQLESSKSFASDFNTRHGIAQPEFWAKQTKQQAMRFVHSNDPSSYVIKADGLASGKGVVLPKDQAEAEAVLEDMFSGRGYDGGGKNGVVFQERLHGPEASVFVIGDGERYIILPLAQDHKRLKNHDKGPNTGGMGAFSPLPTSIVNTEQYRAIETIAAKAFEGMKAEDMPCHGALFIGLMLPKERDGMPVVIEYNCRLGDPETQAVLPVLSASSLDVPSMLLASARGDLSKVVVPKITTSALTVCLATKGYPLNSQKGDAILGLDQTYTSVIVQHGGTAFSGKKLVTSGGRALYVTGLGDTLAQASAAAYAAIGPRAIHFAGMQKRTDIGYQARS